MTKDKSKLQVLSFYMFVIAATFLVVSPILLKIGCIKGVLNWVLLDLNNFKSDYIALVGGMVGAGLAVSSAIYVQARSNIAKDKEDQAIEKKKKKIRSNIISTYIERELIMLWGLWIWSRYETPYRGDSEQDVPFEPYKVSQSLILDNFFELETDLPESSTTTFYNLFYFAEMINGYIEYYMSTYREEMYIDSNGAYRQGDINLNTHYRPSNRLLEITQILRNLIDQKKVELFFQDNSEFESWNDYYTIESTIYNRLKETENKVLKMINQDRNLVPREEKFNLTSTSILSRWLLLQNKEEIDSTYIDYVEKILAIKAELNEIEQKYKNTKKEMIGSIDSPKYSTSIDELLKDLDALYNPDVDIR